MTILPSTQLLLSHKVIFFLVALSISSASSLASVIAILMTAMINANPISPATPNISFHHMSFIILMFNTAFGRFQIHGTSASEANKKSRNIRYYEYIDVLLQV